MGFPVQDQLAISEFLRAWPKKTNHRSPRSPVSPPHAVPRCLLPLRRRSCPRRAIRRSRTSCGASTRSSWREPRSSRRRGAGVAVSVYCAVYSPALKERRAVRRGRWEAKKGGHSGGCVAAADGVGLRGGGSRWVAWVWRIYIYIYTRTLLSGCPVWKPIGSVG